MYVCIYIHTYIIHTYSHVHSHRREANSCHMGSRIALGVDVLSSFNRYIHVYVCMSTMHKAWMCVRICMYADSLEMHTRNKLRMWACISWHVVDFLPDTCILPVSARSLALCSMAWPKSWTDVHSPESHGGKAWNCLLQKAIFQRVSLWVQVYICWTFLVPRFAGFGKASCKKAWAFEHGLVLLSPSCWSGVSIVLTDPNPKALPLVSREWKNGSTW